MAACFALLLVCNTFAQTERIDSLKQILYTQQLSDQQKLAYCTSILELYGNFNLDSSFVYLKKGITLAHRLKNYEEIMKFNKGLGVAFFFRNNYDSSLYYLSANKELAIKLEKEDVLTTTLSLIAVAFAKQGKYHTAIKYFLETLKMAEHTGMTERNVMALANLGEINRRLGNTEIAIQYLKQAEEKSNQLIGVKYGNYTHRILHIYNEHAFNYLNSGNWEEALQYALKANMDFCKKELPVERCYTQGILAKIYLKKNDLERSLEHVQASYKMAELMQDVNLYAFAGKILSDIYLAQKRYIEAEAEALKIWEADSTNVDESRGAVENIVLANIYMKNTEKAAYYFRKYLELSAQYSEKSFHTTVSDLALQYETEKKELQIVSLEKEKQLHYIIGGSGVALCLLAFGLLLFRQRLHKEKYKMAKQKVKQLEQEKQLIATQAVLDGETAERSRLARDLHDGLGGMLSVVKLNLKDMKQFAIMDSGDVQRFGNALEMLDQSIGELRRVAHHIMPESLMRYGLKVSVEDFCRVMPNVHFKYLGKKLRLDNRLEILIYRCAYELINNAVKHAKASHINVQLMIDNGVVSLTVHDNGIGFDPQAVNLGIGLENIRTRLAIYNGRMTIQSSTCNGTEICIEIEPS